MARPWQRAYITVLALMLVLLPACARRPVGRTMSAPPPSPSAEQLVAAGAQEGAAGAQEGVAGAQELSTAPDAPATASQERVEAPAPVPTTPDTPSGLTASPSAVEEPPAEAGPSTATASPPGEPAPEPEVTAPGLASAPVEPPPTDSGERASVPVEPPPADSGEQASVQVAAAAPTTPAPAPEPKPQEFQPVAGLNDIHFDFDEYAIRPEDARILDEDAAWLKTKRNYLILIEGHADERGTSEYNLALGDHRAKAAKSYLVALGVNASRVTILSYGKERPLCVERNESCWSRNRRAHILVKPQ